ncbi:unnamed protein product [Symbiodinium natans]|uniref:TIR domain-containing protein n=1 Tax=Symbiodinium natans TaxID=878477 RepID=A0A812PER2_9DINO|nr:unnamed protein product [Symbiodinium natans]
MQAAAEQACQHLESVATARPEKASAALASASTPVENHVEVVKKEAMQAAAEQACQHLESVATTRPEKASAALASASVPEALSEAAAELTVAGCTDVKERVLDVAEGLQVKLRAGDVALLHGSAVMVTKAENFEAHSLHMETLAPGSMPLPEMSVALSPLLDLHPHGMHFDEPVLLIFPVCVGATKVWRSSDAGWEELVDARLSAGHAILSLDHFCQVVAGAPEPVRKPIKIKGYMKEQTAKWTITHANCKNCEDMLEEYLADPDVLQGYRPCMPLFKTATYSHKQFLELSWPDPSGNANAEPGILNFEEFPVVSTSSWAAPSPPEVKLRLKDADSDSIIQRTLSYQEAPPEEKQLYLAAPADGMMQVCAKSEASSPRSSSGSFSAGQSLGSERMTSREVMARAEALLLDIEKRKGERQRRRERTVTIRAFGPEKFEAASCAQDSGPRLAFFSLRFDKGPVEQTARNVCSILRGRGYEVYIVEGSPDDFGKIVDRYLLRILKMTGVFVAFCTEHYGECTGNPWATYEELRYAHANGIEIMPLKMSEVYPPQPQHEDAEALVRKVLHMGLTREDCVGVSDEQIADKVAKRLRRPRPL